MLSNDTINKIQELYKKGSSKQKIANLLKISYSSVSKYCKNIDPIDEMINKKFNHLTVLELTNCPNDKKNKQKYYICQCDCGNLKTVSKGDLKSNRVKSCGCEKGKHRIGTHNFIDITGQKFGELIALEPTYKLDHTSMIWKCQCSCGKVVEISQHHLTQGQKSCGHLMHDPRGPKNDLTGKKFGLLTVLEPTEYRQTQTVIWKCKCDCGNICYVSTKNLGTNTNSCGCLHSKGERKLQEILNQLSVNYQSEYALKDLIGENNYPRRMDFAIFKNKQLKCFIEYQGIQHYNKNNIWYRPEADEEKRLYCKEKHIPLIEISYTDYKVLDEKYLLTKLKENGIEVIENESINSL